MKKSFYLLLLLMAIASCHDKSMTERMDEIDSLVVRELYDSAYAGVLRINESELTDREDSAHYHLLLVQTSLLTQHPDTLTMLDSLVIPYYNNKGNHEKLAEAYYYKAYRILRQMVISEAIQLYKKAEEQSQYTTNLRLKYKIAESLTYINGIIGNHTLQLNYAQKALEIAKAAQNQEWIANAYCNISFAYSRLHHKDSAVILMKRAMHYSKYIKNSDKPSFLTNAAYILKQASPDVAKNLLLNLNSAAF